jgi:branched-chain amino acid transport system ATP-binding protein
LIQRPKVLLVDELSMGLAPTTVERLFGAIRQIAVEHACAVVFVEQYVGLALTVADRVSVLNHGGIVLHGSTADITAHPELLEEAYLGTDERPEERTNGAAARPAAR